MPSNEKRTKIEHARTASADRMLSQRGQRSLCGELLPVILAKDGWNFHGEGKPPAEVPNAVFWAEREGRRIAFFFTDQPKRELRVAFARIARSDRGEFRLLGVLVSPTTAEMQRCRSVKLADQFPRAFFTSLEEIRALASGSTPKEPELTGGIMSFKAVILSNTPVGGRQSSHYRLAFKAPQLQDIQPPQFIMMDTTPTRVPMGARTVSRSAHRGALDLSPRPLLKRPFGICRDSHPHFAPDYLKHLSLPPSLAQALHIGCADHFDMLYKVLPDGIGTPLMTKLKRGQKVHMLGPLGRPFDVRRLRDEGVGEVHVIGGGVGMAPLVLLVEALRYYAFPVKVFLGIATLESLRYRDELAATFGEKSRDAYIYIDDVLAAGVTPADIFVSFDKDKPPKTLREIPRQNLFHGLLPDQYRKFLAPPPATGSVVAFCCGPNRMMEIVSDIAREAGVSLKLLLEKRMGCGMGVCFSCVQKVRRANGIEDYARICVEGPLFDAKDIVWNNNSQQPSATCGCADRC